MMFIIILLSIGFFSECDYFSKREIREIIELIESKCYSKGEIIDLITENPCQNGHPSSTYISYFVVIQIKFTTKVSFLHLGFFFKSFKIFYSLKSIHF